MTEIHSRAWRGGELVASDFGMGEANRLLAEPDTIVWIDLLQPEPEDFQDLDDQFSLHHLAVEDAAGNHQRPKLDHYAGHHFLASHVLRLDADHELIVREVDAFIGDRWFITVRKDEHVAVEWLLDRWEQSPDLLVHGVPYLLYGLLDLIVDDLFVVVNGFDEYYDEVSEHLFADEPVAPDRQRGWFEVRRNLVLFHRFAVAMREVVSAVIRHERRLVDETMFPYFQDVYDHALRVAEATDAIRDLASTIVETNLSIRDYRQNQIMKKVTSWAAIIAVPTLVTGWYGMNVPFPGFARHWGVWTSNGIMIVLVLALYESFRRRDWL